MNLRKTSSPSDHYMTRIKKKRGISIGKLIYFAVILAIVAGILWWLIDSWFYVKGYGRYTSIQTRVAPLNDSRIERLFVDVNDFVSRGDTLAYLLEANDYRPYQPSSSNTNVQKYIDLQNDLQLLKLEEKQLERTRGQDQNEYENAERLFREGAITIRLYHEIKRKLEESEARLQSIQTRISFTRRKLYEMRQYMEAEGTREQNLIRQMSEYTDRHVYLTAPHAGVVSTIRHLEKEVALRGETILTVNKSCQHYVLAHFDLADESWIYPGKRITVLFENDMDYQGIIRRIHAITHPLSEEFLEQYGRRNKYLTTEIFLIPHTTISPGDFEYVAQLIDQSTPEGTARIDPQLIFDQVVQAGYLEPDGHITIDFDVEKDPTLHRLNRNFRPWSREIVRVLCKVNDEFRYRVVNRKVVLRTAKSEQEPPQKNNLEYFRTEPPLSTLFCGEDIPGSASLAVVDPASLTKDQKPEKETPAATREAPGKQADKPARQPEKPAQKPAARQQEKKAAATPAVAKPEDEPAATSAPSRPAQYSKALELYFAGKTKEALPVFQDYADKHDDSWAANAAYFTGECAFLTSDHDLAIRYLHRVLEKNKRKVPEAMFILGRIAETKGNHQAAVQHWQNLIKQYPSSPVAEKARKKLAE